MPGIVAAQAIVTSDGVALHSESVGRSNAILFVHEYASDHRRWEPQIRRFSRSHRCITYVARSISGPILGCPAVRRYSTFCLEGGDYE